MESAIEYQTKSVKNEIIRIEENVNNYDEKTNYQTQMYNSIKFLNRGLLFFYIVIFIIIHILLLLQYLQGIKRDSVRDVIWLMFFFLYPYLIYYVEKTIYSGVTYLLSLIYGQTYVYQFDNLFLFTDFYSDPGTHNSF